MRLVSQLTVLFLLSFPAIAAQSSAQLEHATASLITDASSISANTPLTVSLKLELNPGWHTYTKDPGDAGLPTRINWVLPEGFTAGEIDWPPAKTFDESGITTYGYEGEVTLPSSITPAADITPDNSYKIAAKVEFMVCKDICIPYTTELALSLTGAENSTPTLTLPSEGGENKAGVPDINLNSPKAPLGFFTALILALIGGVILNLMPCVFPVLSLKALKVAKYAGKERHHVRMEGIAYTLGVMVCFTIIAGLLIALKSTGSAIGWGYQMQSAAFVGTLILLLFAIGLNLSGYFELPVLFGGVDLESLHPHSLKKSFLTGVLATLVATPCTAPFMASAIGYSLTLPPLQSLAIFEMLGLGLALPFLLLSFFPRLLAFFPRPGAWMEGFRQFLAFPMYASAIWLVWVLIMQTGANGAAVALIAAMLLAFSVWLQKATERNALPLVVAIAAIALNGFFLHRLDNAQSTNASAAPAISHGVEFSEQKLLELRASNTAVFVDATAAWCITCQLNYQSSLSNERVQKAFKDKNIVFMVADWTRQNPEITAFLNRFNHSGVPLYVYFPADGNEPKVLPQLLTPDIVLEAISED